ncbi:MAG: TraR/DksA family transcriptional regulator [Fimbriimonadales bacterium]
MASVFKSEELGSIRETLQNLRSRLRGDLDQMTDEALRRDNAGGTGNLSNVPLHMADLGTDNYDQEFTLGLIENEQGTLELINEALGRMEKGTYGQCAECDEPISKPRLQAIPYARHCIQCARKLEGGQGRRKSGGVSAAGFFFGRSP